MIHWPDRPSEVYAMYGQFGNALAENGDVGESPLLHQCVVRVHIGGVRQCNVGSQTHWSGAVQAARVCATQPVRINIIKP